MAHNVAKRWWISRSQAVLLCGVLLIALAFVLRQEIQTQIDRALRAKSAANEASEGTLVVCGGEMFRLLPAANSWIWRAEPTLA